MDLKTAVEDTLDPRPLKKVTLYAGGAALQGIAVGLLLPLLVPNLTTPIRIGISIGCLLVGAVLAVSSYSVLKRRYRIVEKQP